MLEKSLRVKKTVFSHRSGKKSFDKLNFSLKLSNVQGSVEEEDGNSLGGSPPARGYATLVYFYFLLYCKLFRIRSVVQ
jgi:hypothetical protein